MLLGGIEVESTVGVSDRGEGVLSSATFSVPQAERAMVRVKNNGMSFLSIYGFLNLE
jgi:hypothetical protein